MFVPSMLLKQLYTFGSLTNEPEGPSFSIKNRLRDADLTKIEELHFDGEKVPLEQISLQLSDGRRVRASELPDLEPLPFALRSSVRVHTEAESLPEGKHTIDLVFRCKPFGKLSLSVKDAIVSPEHVVREHHIPRDEEDDFDEAIIDERRRYVESFTGKEYEHVFQNSFDPHLSQGNMEQFIGVSQVPLGVAGPLIVHGEHAHGEYLIPLATSEGTLVASYNRGIKVLNLCGGATVSVVGDAMQRAPVFVFQSAREAREFRDWILEHMDEIRREAEATTSVGKLTYVDPYLANNFVYARFNYTTGDAAGQNMVGRATFAACGWIIDTYEAGRIKNFYLESNFATDKKASQVNVMRTRGKRVTAEAVLDREILAQHMRVHPEELHRHWRIATIGAFVSGANNNGAHSPNAITAMFIATGQDVANVSESSAAVLYSEITDEGDLYLSLTIPSLIVATYGGGTGLPTQRECLEMLDCYGRGKVHKFAEIVAATALAGEISLGAAISSSDWVSSHEEYGRNR